jgi:hypothetical protein
MTKATPKVAETSPAAQTSPTATASLPPGSPAADPDVQAARAAVEEARGSFQKELTTLQAKGRDAIDVKAKVRRLPQTLAQDPRKLVGVVAAGAGTVLAVGALRRRGRKPVVAGTLPAEVEAVIADLGVDGKKVRAALDRSFSTYLASHGVAEPAKRRGLPPAVASMILPLGTVAVREAVRLVGARRRAAAEAESASESAPGSNGPE